MHHGVFLIGPSIHVLWMLGDEVCCQVMKSVPCGVIQGDCSRFLRTHGGHVIVDPKPRCKVWLVFIKKTFHPILDPCRYTPKFRMPWPILSSVTSQRKVLDVVSVNVIV